MLKIQARCL